MPPATNIHDHVLGQAAAVIGHKQASAPAKLAELARLLAKYRSHLVTHSLIGKGGLIVRSGPFAGMKMAEAVLEGCFAPKILGCYEQELHGVIERAAKAGYEAVVNIGCAEGYYAVGLARLMPEATVYAYDINPDSQRVVRALAAENGVAKRVVVGGKFGPEDFAKFADRKTLVVCDIEGAERELLDPERAAELAGFDILVELHDLLDEQISRDVIARFAASHDIERIDPGGRDAGAFPELAGLGQLDQFLALWEWRSGPTPWAMMWARPGNGAQASSPGTESEESSEPAAGGDRARADALFDEADRLRRGNRLGAALSRYRAVLAREPDHYAALLRLGALHQSLHSPHLARAYYRRAVQINPGHVRARYRLGCLLLRLGRHGEAESHLRAVAGAPGYDQPLARHLAAYAAFMARDRRVTSFVHDGQRVHFAIGGDNLGHDIFLVGGCFGEDEELAAIRETVPENAVMVDIGANTGSHTVFYGRFLKPRKIIPIEPHPSAVDILLENIALNNIACVDARWLGVGVGAARGKGALARAGGGDLNVTTLQQNGGGPIDVLPLDEIIDEPVDFVKIDTEGMELEVLTGATETIAAHRPILLIEVADRNVESFSERLGALGYEVVREFRRVGYRNYLARPEA